jgi:site-specific recombinase XerD
MIEFQDYMEAKARLVPMGQQSPEVQQQYGAAPTTRRSATLPPMSQQPPEVQQQYQRMARTEVLRKVEQWVMQKQGQGWTREQLMAELAKVMGQ